ncbi:hypothetical protein D560_2247 [Bordetella holmesii ATCC 51541]|nr:hypothetical protein D560_2247 [Bordetella holmesii ATCC 51541]
MWLREIGIEKTWLRTPEHEAAPASAGIEPAIERVVVDPPHPWPGPRP